jgi:hypothetical protein
MELESYRRSLCLRDRDRKGKWSTPRLGCPTTNEQR